MSHKADVKTLVQKLRQKGYSVELTLKGSHWEVRSRTGERISTFSCTPSDKRWRDNAVADIRRWERSRGIPLTAK